MIDSGSIKTSLDSIEEAIESIKNGEVIIVVDDEDRENEGDFICATAKVTPEIINFMARYGRGLICTPITEQRAKALKLTNMVSENTDLHGTAFTVSIDYKKKGCTTGISAYDRATGMQALTQEDTLPEDFARPGHIFPLVAKEGGVLRRTGHTEAAIDLAKLAGLYPSGVLVEILNEDGSMARLPELMVIAENLNLKIISIKDLVAYRMKRERLVSKVKEQVLNTPFGQFNLTSFKEINNNRYHFGLTHGNWEQSDSVLCRVQSTSHVYEIINLVSEGTSNAIHKALKKISEAGAGAMVLLMTAEPKSNNDEIFELISNQIDQNRVVDATPTDHTNKQRDLGIGSQILNELGVRKINLLTRSASIKRVGILGYGLEIVDQVIL